MSVNAIYPKIDTLTSERQHPAHDQIRTWFVEEKLDGTNVRLRYPVSQTAGLLRPILYGRTDRSELPTPLAEDILGARDVFGPTPPRGHVQEVVLGDRAPEPVTLYGEGVGPKVQGNPYRLHSHQFVVFDIKVGDGPLGWLPPEAVHSVCEALHIRHVPVLGTFPLAEIEGLVRHGFGTHLFPATAIEPRPPAEGIVAKCHATLYDARGRRVAFKLKCKDYS